MTQRTGGPSNTSLKLRWDRTVSVAKAARLGMRVRRLAGSHDAEARRRARRALSDALGEMRGLPMKVGQLVAGSEDDEMAQLVDGVDGMSQEQAQTALESGLGALSGRIELGALAHAASLGQVHRATTAEHGAVAVKIQYPHMRANVMSELALTRLLPRWGPVARYGFDLDGYKQVLETDLRAELDYLGEARRQASFRVSTPVSGLIVPEVYSELCSETVLCQRWVDGHSLVEAVDFDRGVRLKIARVLLSTLFWGLFETGMLHGDPHRGNYKFRADGSVVLFDYGCLIEIDEKRRQALLSLVLGLERGDAFPLLDHWVALGFDAKKLGPIEKRLDPLSRVLFAPFLQREAFDPGAYEVGTKFEELLGDLRWWFRSAGPPDLFLVLRAFSGLLEFLRKLDVRLPWRALLHATLPDRTVKRAELYVPPAVGGCIESHGADLLRVRLCRSNGNDVSLAFPAQEALRLSQLLPAETVDAVDARAIESLERRLQREGLSPGVLLEGRARQGRYRIWLE